MKRNSGFFHKYFCRRKICFMFLCPLCVLIYTSGAAVVATLLSSRPCSHQMYSAVASILSCVGFYKPLGSTDPVVVLPATQLSPDTCLFHFPSEEKHVQQLSVLHLFMCKRPQTWLCVCLKASSEGNLSCNATGGEEICGENFTWYFGSRLQKRSISWMP